MEEDKKILEEYVQEFNENKKKYKLAYSTGFGKFWSNFVKAIENLINRNKQLEADNYEQNNIINNYIEIEKEHKKENGELRERLNNEIENHKVLSLDIAQACVDLGLPEDTIIADELVLEINKRYVNKEKMKEILNKYKYTELGNDEEIINFYKELRRLIEERN